MNVPPCLILGSRRQPDALARYVPGYDGIVYFAQQRKDNSRPGLIMIDTDPLLAGVPEYAHRFLATWTNIGKLAFEEEVQATYLMESVTLCLDDRKALAQIRKLLSMFQTLLYGVNGLLKSYEILDECFSCLFTYLILLDNGIKDRLEYLKKSVRQYPNHGIYENFLRIRKLIKSIKQADIPRIAECLFRILIAAAQIDPQVAAERLTCDERFEFLLLIAEQGVRRGIECDILANHCIQRAVEAGYKFSEFKRLKSLPPQYPKGIEVLLKNSDQRKLYFDSQAIIESMEKDTDNSSPFSPRAVPRPVLESLLTPSPMNEHYLPFVTVLPQKGKWILGFKGHDDLRTSWMRYTLSTILRKGLFIRETECPLNSITGGDLKPACPPITDQRCRFRSFKRIFG